MEALRSVPLATLAKASEALNAAKKRKRTESANADRDEAAKAAALQALEQIKKHRKGRSTPRYAAAIDEDEEAAQATSRPEKKVERSKPKEIQHRSNKHAYVDIGLRRLPLATILNVVILPTDLWCSLQDERWDVLGTSLRCPNWCVCTAVMCIPIG